MHRQKLTTEVKPQATFCRVSRPSRLVYGNPGNDELIFIPECQALDLAQVWHAICNATTWGDFRRSLPPGRREQALDWLCEPDAPPPADEDPFDGEEEMDNLDYAWPESPKQPMHRWVPEDVGESYATSTPVERAMGFVTR